MKLTEFTGGLRPRLLAAVALMVMVSGIALQIMAMLSTVPMVSQNLDEVVSSLIERGELSRCEAAPETWEVRSEGIRIHAYDARTQRSHNPGAPPLDAKIAARLATTEDGHAMRMLYLPETLWTGRSTGGIMATRVTDRGPCAILQLSWPLRIMIRLRRLLVPMMGVLFVCIMGVVLIIGRGAITPLIERIARLREMADEVGKEDAVLDPKLSHGDELDQIAHVLVSAHARIRTDAEELAEQRRALERHISEVTHDLRTPMTAMGLALEELTRGPDASALTTAIGELQYMTSLIENLRLGVELRDPMRELGRVPVDLVELIEQVARRQHMIARQRGIQVNVSHPDAPLEVIGDPTMITQVLTNLVQNAITYNDEGGHVAVLLEQPSPDTFSVRVIDDGPGVQPEELARLSARTFRTDAARTRRPEGDGLGLAIVRAVCERHGWTLTIGANEPRGLSVEITGSL